MVVTIDTLLRDYDEQEFRALAGLSMSTFRVLYDKYCGPGTPICKPTYLFVLFKYYKLYPVERAWSTIFPGHRSSRSFLFRLRTWEVRKQTQVSALPLKLRLMLIVSIASVCFALTNDVFAV
jgi:hypothetical protein